jgi:uncharacterized membrane protein YbhN (UPF0104 family)
MVEAERPRGLRGLISPRLLSLLISAALLAVGGWILGHRIDWRDAISIWTNLDPVLVVGAMVLYWLQHPLNAYRFQRVMLWTTGRPPSELPSFGFLFKLTCGAAFVAAAAPVGLAGDAAKVAALRLFASLSTTDAARCALFDRVVGVQCLSLLGLATLPLQAALGVGHAIILPQLSIFAALLAAVGALLVFPRALALLRSNAVNHVARVFTGYRLLLYPHRLAIQLAISLTNFVLSWGSLYLLLSAAGLSVNPWIVAGFIPLLQLVNGLPFLYMGWGGRELAMAATLGVAGHLALNETLAVSIAWGAVLIVTSAVNGIFLLGHWRVNHRAPPEDGRAAGASPRARPIA